MPANEWDTHQAILNGVLYERSDRYPDLCLMNSNPKAYYCSLPRGHEGRHLAFVGHSPWGELAHSGPWLDDEVMVQLVAARIDKILEDY